MNRSDFLKRAYNQPLIAIIFSNIISSHKLIMKKIVFVTLALLLNACQQAPKQSNEPTIDNQVSVISTTLTVLPIQPK